MASSASEDALLSALVSILQTGTGPAVLAAQQALLRRLVLQGDVIPSRLPAPKNITEIGGYLNLLTQLGDATMRSEVLASVLGVAQSNDAYLAPPGHPLGMLAMANDRPTGSAQASIPLQFYVRSDFAQGIKAALDAVHAQGATLPLYSLPIYLPPRSPTFTAPTDWLPYIGRELQVFPPAALSNPSSDPIALAATVSGGPYQIVSRATGAGGPAASQWYALQSNAGAAASEISLTAASLVPIAPILSLYSGFYALPQITAPSSPDDTWSVLKNITGLIPGVTSLGSELALLHPAGDIGQSAAVPYLRYVWDGTTFSAL